MPHLSPLIPGHEVVGRVTEVGPGCTRFASGARVGIAWLGICRFCLRGAENLCLEPRFTLAPAPRDFSDRISVERGDPIFSQIGCSGCHVRTTFRTPANPAPLDIGNGEETIRVPANFAFNPFGDFLLHDMGALGDRIGEPRLVNGQLVQETAAQTRQMRTAPLWGIRFRNKLLHDGRCSDVACAIRAHDGQAAASRNAFNAWSSTNQHNVVQFVRSL